jgi:hypothetical protein
MANLLWDILLCLLPADDSLMTVEYPIWLRLSREWEFFTEWAMQWWIVN